MVVRTRDREGEPPRVPPLVENTAAFVARATLGRRNPRAGGRVTANHPRSARSEGDTL